MVLVIHTIISYICDSMSKIVVLFTFTNRALCLLLHVVANPVHCLLDRTRSEEHLQSYNESMKTKTKQKKQGNNNPKHSQKTIEEEGHCKEVQRSTCHIMVQQQART